MVFDAARLNKCSNLTFPVCHNHNGRPSSFLVAFSWLYFPSANLPGPVETLVGFCVQVFLFNLSGAAAEPKNNCYYCCVDY